ncbi:hypothetical protein COCSUDRAFT_33961 [Coccomyxa subellipsoidea C-169]|uniref:Uncharacterized protein n=1 Tax=Coccomyxa subellipsoidea (strain C-169) TaxID=574566 RepID=I0YPR7_COCSC|nr:hypothetical protein COCSUDRAFT_33961 [Coccomyxa subellipsoidea C-169]EIE20386.1 hypothetical protein COCSUDRAFT_33961 [Coccomyxa subellipsoidea C-169]|eukprot:XP_005644930.1 hypothetical protein COCSUDRAFT_33961 [Coccomyxa subellipsoidea C-169]
MHARTLAYTSIHKKSLDTANAWQPVSPGRRYFTEILNGQHELIYCHNTCQWGFLDTPLGMPKPEPCQSTFLHCCECCRLWRLLSKTWKQIVSMT